MIGLLEGQEPLNYGRPNGARFKKINLHHNSTVTFNVKNYV